MMLPVNTTTTLPVIFSVLLPTRLDLLKMQVNSVEIFENIERENVCGVCEKGWFIFGNLTHKMEKI